MTLTGGRDPRHSAGRRGLPALSYDSTKKRASSPRRHSHGRIFPSSAELGSLMGRPGETKIKSRMTLTYIYHYFGQLFIYFQAGILPVESFIFPS